MTFKSELTISSRASRDFFSFREWWRTEIVTVLWYIVFVFKSRTIFLLINHQHKLEVIRSFLGMYSAVTITMYTSHKNHTDTKTFYNDNKTPSPHNLLVNRFLKLFLCQVSKETTVGNYVHITKITYILQFWESKPVSAVTNGPTRRTELDDHCDKLAATRCGGKFKHEFVANLPLSLPAKEFWKSVNTCGSYGQKFSVLFFWLTVYAYIMYTSQRFLYYTTLWNLNCQNYL